MSNIYVTEPPTQGKIVVKTSLGEIDVELWPREAPKACRNFVQLCLDGYYDDTIFHRLIPNFMLQGGDPTATGQGGESSYGEAFADEFHSRLRFTHRGILAMANENKPNSNHSQFFFTLDKCEWLNKKHTIFGKVTGNTIFNLLRANEADTDKDDRPFESIRFISAEVIWNPFDDVVARATKKVKVLDEASRREQEHKERQKNRKATKNAKLLSFGEEVEEEEKTDAPSGIKSTHDLTNDPKLSKNVDPELERLAKNAKETSSEGKLKGASAALKQVVSKRDKPRGSAEDFEEKMRAAVMKKHLETKGKTTPKALAPTPQQEEDWQSSEDDNPALKKRKVAAHSRREEIQELRNQLVSHTVKAEKMSKAVPVTTGEKLEKIESEIAEQEMYTPLEQRRRKYQNNKKAYGNRQKETLEKLFAFQKTVQQAKKVASSETLEEERTESYHGQVTEKDDEEIGKDDPTDISWMAAKLKFKKHIDDAYRAGADPDEYVTVDTRDERRKKGNVSYDGRRSSKGESRQK